MKNLSYPILIIFLLSFLIVLSLDSKGQDSTKNLLSTGITGSTSSHGMESPQYILSLRPVQELVLEAAEGPLTKKEIRKKLNGIPTDLDKLLELKILRQENEYYYLNYLVMTIKDQQKIFDVAQRYAESLSTMFTNDREYFLRLLNKHQVPDTLQDETLFTLIAGFILNWEGLKTATKLGYRPEPTTYPNGDRYILHSSEIGFKEPTVGMYWGSHSTTTHLPVVFTTFGDGNSIPRLKGIPDLYETIYSNGFDTFKKDDKVFKAVATHFVTYIEEVEINDAGSVVFSLAKGSKTVEELADALKISDARLGATLQLLEAFNHIRKTDNERYVNSVPVFTDNHQQMVNEALKKGRNLLQTWLLENYEPLKKELESLTPIKNGLPFSLVFNEVWHYLFGFSTRYLAESEFYINPRNPDYRFDGYVPLVWSSDIYAY